MQHVYMSIIIYIYILYTSYLYITLTNIIISISFLYIMSILSIHHGSWIIDTAPGLHRCVARLDPLPLVKGLTCTANASTASAGCDAACGAV